MLTRKITFTALACAAVLAGAAGREARAGNDRPPSTPAPCSSTSTPEYAAFAQARETGVLTDGEWIDFAFFRLGVLLLLTRQRVGFRRFGLGLGALEREPLIAPYHPQKPNRRETGKQGQTDQQRRDERLFGPRRCRDARRLWRLGQTALRSAGLFARCPAARVCGDWLWRRHSLGGVELAWRRFP